MLELVVLVVQLVTTMVLVVVVHLLVLTALETEALVVNMEILALL
jgi:hypothetical protein